MDKLSRDIKVKLRKLSDPVEAKLLGQDYFLLQKGLSYPSKISLLWKKIASTTNFRSLENKPEITFLLYSRACERLLMPLIIRLAENRDLQGYGIKMNVIVLFGIHQLELSTANLQEIQRLNIEIQNDYYSLIRACHQPEQKLVVACLDHRRKHKYHFWGVDTIDKLKRCGVKTLSIQHGGTRADSVKDLASAASDTVLVWGKRVYRELVNQHGVESRRLRLVGNPLHDRLAHLEPTRVRKDLLNSYPELDQAISSKRVILLATTLQSEYADQPNEQELYCEYIRHIYESIDFAENILLIKMHPLDSVRHNLYREMLPAHISDSVKIIEPSQTELDVYSLLLIANLLITRASTVAEEALIMHRDVISFDLTPGGPSKGYKHLEEYGQYKTVYQQPISALREAIESTKSRQMQTAINDDSTTSDLTYRLDGKSTDRAVEAILQEVISP